MNKFYLTNSSLIGLLFLFFGFPGFSQVNVEASAEMEIFTSSEDNLPFWLRMNRRGRVTEETKFLGLMSSEAKFGFKKHQLRIGGGIFYNEAFGNEVNFDEAFLQYNYKWLKIILGQKQRQELYNGLSATNENILWSLNAAPLPGIQVKTSNPIYFSKSPIFGFEAAWEEYSLGEDRFVKNARLHHKQLSFVFKPREDWKIIAGVQHFAFWGGTSPEFGKQPTGIEDYLRVFTAREGGENALMTDQLNVLGAHMGSYELQVLKTFQNFNLEFIFNSIFEDGSGSRGANFPDGRYGLFYSAETRDKWISSVIYEFYYTKDQSQTGPHLFDSYFSGGVYASGWTNQSRVLGVPFITTNHYVDDRIDPSITRIGNNTLIVHHVGLAGNLFQQIPYKFLLSYRKNYGHYRNTGYRTFEFYAPDDHRGQTQLAKEIVSQYLNLRLLNSNLKVDLNLAADFSEKDQNFGGGITLRYDFNN